MWEESISDGINTFKFGIIIIIIIITDVRIRVFPVSVLRVYSVWRSPGPGQPLTCSSVKN